MNDTQVYETLLFLVAHRASILVVAPRDAANARRDAANVGLDVVQVDYPNLGVEVQYKQDDCLQIHNEIVLLQVPVTIRCTSYGSGRPTGCTHAGAQLRTRNSRGTKS